jgi:lipoyl(octanoyl) transferase
LTYSNPNKNVLFQDLGLVCYKEAWDLQEGFLKEQVNIKINNQQGNLELPTENRLLFCEHPHVYTLGKSGKENNLLINEKMMEQVGAEFFPVNRGGDITYHGPGQLVAYPIFDLENFFTDIHLYMRSLEEVVIQTCAKFGIMAGRITDLTGVWVDIESDNPRKICALGVKTSRWVTIHGLALNVNTNLDYFGYIVPCGITDKPVTSIQKELGKEVNMNDVKEEMLKAFESVFQLSIIREQLSVDNRFL